MRRLAWSCLGLAFAIGCGDDTTGSSGTEGSDDSGGSSTSTMSGGEGSTSDSTVSDGMTDESSDGTSADATSSGDGGSSSSDGGGSSSSGDGGSSSSGDMDASSSGDASSSSSDGGDTGQQVGPCYDQETHPWDGSLCGPATAPCSVLVDESVDPTAHFRNGSPAVTHAVDCEPLVLYSVAEGGYQGYLADRDPVGGWDTSNAPDPTALGGLAWDTGIGAARVFMYDGAFGVHQSTYDGAFADAPDPGGQAILRAYGVASLGTGTVHLGLSESDNEVGYGLWDAGWNLDTIAEGDYVAAAVSPDDTPHLSWWSSVNGTWELFWVEANGGTPEVVSALGSNGLSIADHGIATIGATPHVVFARVIGGDLHEVVHAYRQGADDWVLGTVIAEDPLAGETCSIAPVVAGQTCDYDYIRYRPLGIVTSHGGDVRILYAQDHYLGTLISECEMFPFPFCMWTTSIDESVGTMWMAWPDDGGGYETTMLLDRWIAAMDLDLDGTGRIHIAAYVPESDGTVVDYLQLGP